MNPAEKIGNFYMSHLPGAVKEGFLLKAPCPLCGRSGEGTGGTLVVYLNPDSLFLGYFRCLSRCTPGGFPLHFGRVMGISPDEVPGHDPDRESFARDIQYPAANLNAEIRRFRALMDEEQFAYFREAGISGETVEEMAVGYNGRYLVYPYFLEDDNCYAARCVMPGRDEDSFWHGNEAFFDARFRIFNVREIDRCEGGALFVTEGEENLLALRELGYPGIAVPAVADLDALDPERFAFIRHVLVVLNHTPESRLAARALAGRFGFKTRILEWPSRLPRGYALRDLAREKGGDFRTAVSSMIRASRSFSPFPSPEKERRRFVEVLEGRVGQGLLGFSTGFRKMDRALNGIRGINVMGGPPKAGKSCFFMQLSTEMARRKIPVIYYDFENGRQKIYTRTLCRLARASEEEILRRDRDPAVSQRLESALEEMKRILAFFRVVTDRKLSPGIMRRQIDFLRHETRRDEVLVVVDSLHKLPFKDLSERRTGIDAWLRHLEAIRDEQDAAFLVISELSRGEGGGYSRRPDLGSFKESGDIEYSADNALILMPGWDPLDPVSGKERKSTLWTVASRESSPGKVADYLLEYPFWGFREL